MINLKSWYPNLALPYFKILTAVLRTCGYCGRMEGEDSLDSLEAAETSYGGIATELADMKQALGLIMETISQERDAPAESLRILANLEHVQDTQRELHNRILSFFSDLSADKGIQTAEKGTQNTRLAGLLPRVQAEEESSLYIARVQAGIWRFCVLIAHELKSNWSTLAEQLFLESNEGESETQAAIQAVMEDHGMSYKIWEDCQAVNRLHSLSTVADQPCLATEDTAALNSMVVEEVCPEQMAKFRDSVLSALEYVVSQGYWSSVRNCLQVLLRYREKSYKEEAGHTSLTGPAKSSINGNEAAELHKGCNMYMLFLSLCACIEVALAFLVQLLISLRL